MKFTTSGLWPRTCLSLITEPECLDTGTSGFQGSLLHISSTILHPSYPIYLWVFLTTLPVDSQEVHYISHVQFFRLVFSGKSWRPCQTLASITSASRLVIGLGRSIQASLSLTRSSTTPIPWELSSTSRGCLSGSISWGWELTSTCTGLQALRTGERIFLRKNYFEVEGLTTAGGLVQQTGWKRGRWRVVDCPTQLINIYQDIAG